MGFNSDFVRFKEHYLTKSKLNNLPRSVANGKELRLY